MRKSALMAVIFLLIFATAGWSQLPSKPFNLYAGGGISNPTSPDAFKEGWKLGFHGSGGLGINFGVVPNFQIIGKVEFHTMPFDWDKAGLPDASGGAFQVLMFGADGKFALGVPAAPMKPFVIGGAGIAKISVSDITNAGSTVAVDADETDFYFNVGAGMEFGSGPAMKFFILARYVHIATEGESTAFIPVTAGIKF